jgi:hypothetical protein
MADRIPRREAIRRLALFSAAAAAPAWLLACKGKPSCTDVSGLSSDDINARNNTAAYVDATPDPAKKCSNCVQFVAAGDPKACGSCKVVKGPINPEGYCRLWVAKPA